MNHWAFVTAAYAFVGVGSAALGWLSWQAMRRAEAAADAIGRRE